jgi:hypothetical protein
MLQFDWQMFIADGVFKGIGDVSLGENEVILVNHWDYITNASNIFSQELKDDIKYILCRAFFGFICAPKRNAAVYM